MSSDNNGLNPTQTYTEIATLPKPDLTNDSVYYGKYFEQGGPSSVRPITSLSDITGLLDAYAALSKKNEPEPIVNGFTVEERVQAAKNWISYFGPDGVLEKAVVASIHEIIKNSF